MKKISLAHMQTHKKARIVEIVGNDTLQNKFMSMGIYKGREILKLGHFALRGPVTIKVGRSTLALGNSMANKIMVEMHE